MWAEEGGGFRKTVTAAWAVGTSSELGDAEKGSFTGGWKKMNQCAQVTGSCGRFMGEV